MPLPRGGQIPALTSKRSGILSKLCNPSKVQFPPLLNGAKNITPVVSLELGKIINIRQLEQYLVHWGPHPCFLFPWPSNDSELLSLLLVPCSLNLPLCLEGSSPLCLLENPTSIFKFNSHVSRFTQAVFHLSPILPLFLPTHHCDAHYTIMIGQHVLLFILTTP